MVTRGNTSLSLDNDDEFFAEIQRDYASVLYMSNFSVPVVDSPFVMGKLHISMRYGLSEVTVGYPDRQIVDRIMNVFEAHREGAALPPPAPPLPPPPPTIFIGHGHSPDWRDLKDHLHDLHGYEVVHFEIGARAGHAVRDVLEDMLDRSTFAVLVLTGEDEMATGDLRPRENVIHEAGLFQGKLGFNRAILAVEEGVQPFSNVAGIVQLRYSKGNIKEIIGELLATLKREFG